MDQRIQKLLASAGIASRRKAEAMIAAGQVTVNGRIAKLGEKADPDVDAVRVSGQPLRPERKVYLALNKPIGCITSVSDPEGRPTVMDLVRVGERVVPAGRLDYTSEGLVILTNDGELIGRITRAGVCPKVYLVKTKGALSADDMATLQRGIRLEGKKLAPCRIRLHKEGDNCWYQITLFQGVNRQIRRMLAALGHGVSRIRRVSVGPVALGKLKPGEWRWLTPDEIKALKLQRAERMPQMADRRHDVRSGSESDRPRRKTEGGSRAAESRASGNKSGFGERRARAHGTGMSNWKSEGANPRPQGSDRKPGRRRDVGAGSGSDRPRDASRPRAFKGGGRKQSSDWKSPIGNRRSQGSTRNADRRHDVRSGSASDRPRRKAEGGRRAAESRASGNKSGFGERRARAHGTGMSNRKSEGANPRPQGSDRKPGRRRDVGAGSESDRPGDASRPRAFEGGGRKPSSDRKSPIDSR